MLLLEKDNAKIISCFADDISAFLKLYTKHERKSFLAKMLFFFPLDFFVSIQQSMVCKHSERQRNETSA